MEEQNYLRSLDRIAIDFNNIVSSLTSAIYELEDYATANCNSRKLKVANLESERFNANTEKEQSEFINFFAEVTNGVKKLKAKGLDENRLRDVRLESFVLLDRKSFLLKRSIDKLVHDIKNKFYEICPPVTDTINVKDSNNTDSIDVAEFISTEATELSRVTQDDYDLLASLSLDKDYAFI